MYTRELKVQPSDASCLGQIKLHSLLDYLQDTASLAVEDLEGTATELMARGYAWVLTRYEVELTGSLPLLDERFIIRTYHDPNHGYGTLRIFEVVRPDGTPLVWAKTSWLLLDLAAGRPVRPVAHLPKITERDTASITPDFPDIPAFPQDGEIRESPCPIRFHDLDTNGHVNNAVYFEWVFEATPLDPMKYGVRSISASFRSGARWGENLRIQVAELPSSSEKRDFVYRIIDEKNEDGGMGKPKTQFACNWEERS
ncbi:MAG: hypothetical protein K5841_10965 [Fretibacterium sp.]|nr:hypothetical protein [Fretibacterium sp.]